VVNEKQEEKHISKENFSSYGNNFSVSFQIESSQSSFGYAHIIIPSNIVDKLYTESARAQQHSIHAYGFNRGEVPLEYIKQNFESNIVSHMKKFLFKFSVLNTLLREIRNNKIPVANEPRLVDIKLGPNQESRFIFELSLFPNLQINDWKYLPFKAPKRKNYKDLDRQVEFFIKEERTRLKNNNDQGIAVGDWVEFAVSLVDEKNNPLFDNQTEKFWFKVGDEEVSNPIRELFLHKHVGDVFCTKNAGLQEYFSIHTNTIHNFQIHIMNVVSNAFFCFELFKRHFKIKTNSDMNKKLIEVFSYRHDLSQRRSMVEETLKLFLSKNKFDIPNHLILREQKILLENIKNNPDYNVYRVQKDFTHRIRQLAEKTVKEKILVDRLAYQENIAISDQDIKSYLNLTMRPRTKEFIYFEHPEPMLEGQEIPIPAEELTRTCLREKTINYAIYHLTKK